MGYTGYRSIRRPDIANISKYFYSKNSLFIARTIKSVKYIFRKKGVSAQDAKNKKQQHGLMLLAALCGVQPSSPDNRHGDHRAYDLYRHPVSDWRINCAASGDFEARRVPLWAHMKADRRFALRQLSGASMFGGIGLRDCCIYRCCQCCLSDCPVCACGATSCGYLCATGSIAEFDCPCNVTRRFLL